MEEFQNRYTRLNTAQRQAVDSIEGPVLVIAGPGTGKTELLSMRVANILLKSDAQPQNILCLTFTESAAFEMRQRLINIIGQQAYNVTISTYHAFGSELIRRFPDYFTDNQGQQAIDELGIHRILQEIIDNLPYRNALKKSAAYLGDIKSTISDCKRALLTPADLRAIAGSNQQLTQALDQAVTQNLTGLVRIAKNSIPQFEALLASTTVLAEPEQVIGTVKSLGYLWQRELKNALEEVSATDKTAPLTAWKNKWLIRDQKGQLAVNGPHVQQKLLALADIYEQYLQTLAEQELFDYDDMILQAIAGLQNNPELRFTLQEQYMYMLLDEFQDTNEAQLRLVQLLTDNPLYEGRPNVMAVGDDDQAIYAFQGADYSHMLTFQKSFKDTLIICLTDNYRSHQAILQVAAHIAEQIETRLHHSLEDITKELVSKNDQLPKQASIVRREFKSDVSQYAWITKQIAELVKQGTDPSEIAVLAPQHKYLEPLLPYLRQLSIPVRYDKRENILEDPHLRQLFGMGQLVWDLAQQNNAAADARWPEVLSYDFWQLPTELIWQLSWQATDDKKSWLECIIENPNTKVIGLFFMRLSNLVATESLETILDYLIGSQPLEIGKSNYSCAFYQYNFGAAANAETTTFWNILSNLTVLRARLRDYRNSTQQQLSLQDLLTFVQAHLEARIKVLNTSPYHESAAAVQLMTAYKAKGMEFGHVFLVACVDEVWGGRALSSSNKLSLPPNLSHVRYKGASHDERLRLFFVAITRAKYGLYLTSYRANFANKLTSRLQYLQETDQAAGSISPLLPSASQTILKDDSEVPALEDLTAYWQERHLPSSTSSIKELLRPRLDRYQMAPTHLNSFTDLIYGGPANFFLNTILRFPQAPTADSVFGNAIHQTIEWIHLQQRSGQLPATPAVIEQAHRLLDAAALSTSQKELLKERASACLKVFYKQRQQSFMIGNEHELSFYDQGVFVGEAHLNGKIDKLIIDKKQRTIVVVDYKTGSSSSRWKRDTKLHKYQQQLYFYKLLVEGSHRFADYRVVGGYLEFVEPDENGQIITLETDFTNQSMQQLKGLITSVWQHIKDLQFPDTSGYEATMHGIEQFEDDLRAGKL